MNYIQSFAKLTKRYFHTKPSNEDSIVALHDHIKPISYLKANAAQIVTELKNDGDAYIITQNGEAAMVVQSVEEYERKENAIAMLQLINQGERDISEGGVQNADSAFDEVRQKLLGK
jgi:prevent-host-death family protein